jgi:hypothetical protein
VTELESILTSAFGAGFLMVLVADVDLEAAFFSTLVPRAGRDMLQYGKWSK